MELGLADYTLIGIAAICFVAIVYYKHVCSYKE